MVAGGKRATGVDNFDNHPMNYKVPHFGVDQDIIDTQNHLKQNPYEMNTSNGDTENLTWLLG